MAGKGIEKTCLQTGDYLFHTGDEADCAYLVEEGELLVHHTRDGKEVPFARIGPNEIVGEIAIIGDQPRMASVKASKPTTLVPISQERMDVILESDPAMVKRLLRVLVRRLLELHDIIIEQREELLSFKGPAPDDVGGGDEGDPASLDEQEAVSRLYPLASKGGEQPPVTSLLRSTPTVEEPQAGDEMSISLPGGLEIDFCFVPSGSFTMGTQDVGITIAKDETPQRRVELTKPFWVGKTPITQAQWMAVMRATSMEYDQDDCPVVRVSWYDCQEFLKKLRTQQDKGFRLPTEAEWEYACRAGTKTQHYWGDDVSELEIGDYAWFCDNSGRHIQPVAYKLPNAYGLQDMLGNVWEWCQDRYGPYRSEPQIDPRGPHGGKEQVVRGSCCRDIPALVRCAKRYGFEPRTKSDTIGFRLARTHL